MNLKNVLFVFVGHRKRNGKDTICNIIYDHLYNTVVEVYRGSCIQYAREIVDELFPNYEKHEDSKDKPNSEYNNISYRDAVIGVVKSMLSLDELCLSKKLIKDSLDIVDSYDESETFHVFVIPDCRREVEADYFKEVLGDSILMVEVDNPRVENKDSYGEGTLDGYEWDVSIKNDGNLEKLKKSVHQNIINIINLKVENFYETT